MKTPGNDNGTGTGANAKVGALTDDPRGTRRHFLVGALTSMPALAYLYGCEGRSLSREVERLDSPLGAGEGGHDNGPLAGWGDPAFRRLSRRERLRRRWLRRNLLRHVRAENDHDIEAIMRTMADDAEMIVNGQRFDTHEAIRGGHTEFGMSEMMGGLVGTEVTLDQAYFTDDAILTRGLVRAQHVGPAAGFPGSGLQVELTYAAFYQFNHRGKLVSERITMDWSPLLAGAAGQGM